MNGPREYHQKRQIPLSLTLESKKTNECIKQNRNGLGYREQTSGYQTREGKKGASQGLGIKRYKLLCIK